MDFRFVQNRQSRTTLNGENAYGIFGNQKVICYYRNDRLMLVLLTYSVLVADAKSIERIGPSITTVYARIKRD